MSSGNSSSKLAFSSGHVVATAGIEHALNHDDNSRAFVLDCLRRHLTGDWGDLDAHDCALNNASASDEAIAAGDRVVSSYPVPGDLRSPSYPNDHIYVITSLEPLSRTETIQATTILWPSEY